MLIRRLSSEDAKAFKAIRLESLALNPEAFGASHDDEAAQSLEQVANRLSTSIVFGGFDPTGALQGVIGLRKETALKLKHIATIWGMYVSPVSRGSGLAERLLRAAVTEAQSSCTTIRLSVVVSNKSAQRLYENMGFRTWAVDSKALCVDGVFLDEALMRFDFV